MKIFAETERLILRELTHEDIQGMFLLDSDPEVHKFLGGNAIKTIKQAEETIEFIRSQYDTLGIGRWAVIDKKSGDFLGWSGLKFITGSINGKTGYYDLGYRFLKRHWGKGYATEAAIASLDYGFKVLKLKEIFAIADCQNLNSCRILEKSGFEFVEIFDYLGKNHHWCEIKK